MEVDGEEEEVEGSIGDEGGMAVTRGPSVGGGVGGGEGGESKVVVISLDAGGDKGDGKSRGEGASVGIGVTCSGLGGDESGDADDGGNRNGDGEGNGGGHGVHQRRIDTTRRAALGVEVVVVMGVEEAEGVVEVLA